MQKFKRSKFLVNKRLQLKYVLINICLMLFIALIVGGGVYINIWRSVVKEFSTVQLARDFETITRMREYEGVRQGRTIELLPVLREEAKMLSEQQKKIINKILKKSNMNMIPFIVIVLIFIFIIGIFYTHRLAGPAVGIIKSLEAVSKGDLTQNFKLRSKDELKDVALAIEKVINDFSNTIKNTKELSKNFKNADTVEEKEKIIVQIEQIYSNYKI